jgi:hypothetical protein
MLGKFCVGLIFNILGVTFWKLLEKPFFTASNYFGDLENSMILRTKFLELLEMLEDLDNHLPS